MQLDNNVNNGIDPLPCNIYSDFLNLIFVTLQPNVLDLRYFRLWFLLDWISFKKRIFTQWGCKDIWIREFEFVAKTQFHQCSGYLEIVFPLEIIQIIPKTEDYEIKIIGFPWHYKCYVPRIIKW